MRDRKSGRVLVYGDDMRIFLAVVRSLGRAGKEVHAVPFDHRSPALRSRYISCIHHLPPYSDAPAEWRDAAVALFRAQDFGLIVPCDDRAILPLHAHRDAFAPFPVAIPHAELMELLFDKERTRAICAELNVPVASGARLSPSDTAQDLVRRFGLPLVLKPRRSYWLDSLQTWGKVWIVESAAELERLLARIAERERYLVESFFAGDGVGVSVLADTGEILQAFQHRRLREGLGGSSSYRISEPLHPELLEAAARICRHTRLTGVCMFEFRRNARSGGWVLIETNARFWGSMPLPLSLGVDFPLYLHALMARGLRLPWAHYPAGIRGRNLVLDGFNLVSQARRLRPSQIPAWLAQVADYALQPLRWITGRERSDSVVRDDLRPALVECCRLPRAAWQKLMPFTMPGARRERRMPAPREAAARSG